jgi:hypothetical protein
MTYTIEEMRIISARHVKAAFWRHWFQGFATGAGLAAVAELIGRWM